MEREDVGLMQEQPPQDLIQKDHTDETAGTPIVPVYPSSRYTYYKCLLLLDIVFKLGGCLMLIVAATGFDEDAQVSVNWSMLKLFLVVFTFIQGVYTVVFRVILARQAEEATTKSDHGVFKWHKTANLANAIGHCGVSAVAGLTWGIMSSLDIGGDNMARGIELAACLSISLSAITHGAAEAMMLHLFLPSHTKALRAAIFALSISLGAMSLSLFYPAYYYFTATPDTATTGVTATWTALTAAVFLGSFAMALDTSRVRQQMATVNTEGVQSGKMLFGGCVGVAVHALLVFSFRSADEETAYGIPQRGLFIALQVVGIISCTVCIVCTWMFKRPYTIQEYEMVALTVRGWVLDWKKKELADGEDEEDPTENATVFGLVTLLQGVLGAVADIVFMTSATDLSDSVKLQIEEVASANAVHISLMIWAGLHFTYCASVKPAHAIKAAEVIKAKDYGFFQAVGILLDISGVAVACLGGCVWAAETAVTKDASYSNLWVAQLLMSLHIALGKVSSAVFYNAPSGGKDEENEGDEEVGKGSSREGEVEGDDGEEDKVVATVNASVTSIPIGLSCGMVSMCFFYLWEMVFLHNQAGQLTGKSQFALVITPLVLIASLLLNSFHDATLAAVAEKKSAAGGGGPMSVGWWLVDEGVYEVVSTSLLLCVIVFNLIVVQGTDAQLSAISSVAVFNTLLSLAAVIVVHALVKRLSSKGRGADEEGDGEGNGGDEEEAKESAQHPERPLHTLSFHRVFLFLQMVTILGGCLAALVNVGGLQHVEDMEGVSWPVAKQVLFLFAIVGIMYGAVAVASSIKWAVQLNMTTHPNYSQVDGKIMKVGQTISDVCTFVLGCVIGAYWAADAVLNPSSDNIADNMFKSDMAPAMVFIAASPMMGRIGATFVVRSYLLQDRIESICNVLLSIAISSTIFTFVFVWQFFMESQTYADAVTVNFLAGALAFGCLIARELKPALPQFCLAAVASITIGFNSLVNMASDRGTSNPTLFYQCQIGALIAAITVACLQSFYLSRRLASGLQIDPNAILDIKDLNGPAFYAVDSKGSPNKETIPSKVSLPGSADEGPSNKQQQEEEEEDLAAQASKLIAEVFGEEEEAEEDSENEKILRQLGFDTHPPPQSAPGPASYYQRNRDDPQRDYDGTEEHIGRPNTYQGAGVSASGQEQDEWKDGGPRPSQSRGTVRFEDEVDGGFGSEQLAFQQFHFDQQRPGTAATTTMSYSESYMDSARPTTADTGMHTVDEVDDIGPTPAVNLGTSTTLTQSANEKVGLKMVNGRMVAQDVKEDQKKQMFPSSKSWANKSKQPPATRNKVEEGKKTSTGPTRGGVQNKNSDRGAPAARPTSRPRSRSPPKRIPSKRSVSPPPRGKTPSTSESRRTLTTSEGRRTTSTPSTETREGSTKSPYHSAPTAAIGRTNPLPEVEDPDKAARQRQEAYERELLELQKEYEQNEEKSKAAKQAEYERQLREMEREFGDAPELEADTRKQEEKKGPKREPELEPTKVPKAVSEVVGRPLTAEESAVLAESIVYDHSEPPRKEPYVYEVPVEEDDLRTPRSQSLSVVEQTPMRGEEPVGGEEERRRRRKERLKEEWSDDELQEMKSRKSQVSLERLQAEFMETSTDSVESKLRKEVEEGRGRSTTSRKRTDRATGKTDRGQLESELTKRIVKTPETSKAGLDIQRAEFEVTRTRAHSPVRIADTIHNTIETFKRSTSPEREAMRRKMQEEEDDETRRRKEEYWRLSQQAPPDRSLSRLGSNSGSGGLENIREVMDNFESPESPDMRAMRREYLMSSGGAPPPTHNAVVWNHEAFRPGTSAPSFQRKYSSESQEETVPAYVKSKRHDRERPHTTSPGSSNANVKLGNFGKDRTISVVRKSTSSPFRENNSPKRTPSPTRTSSGGGLERVHADLNETSDFNQRRHKSVSNLYGTDPRKFKGRGSMRRSPPKEEFPDPPSPYAPW